MLTPIFVVLGMHRGGTSVVARGLTALGVSLGDNLWGPKPENERGFWEDRDIYAINEELLSTLGEEWDSVRLFDTRKLSPPHLDGMIVKGQLLLAEKLAINVPYGFKDPRTGRLLFYWRQVFDVLAVEPRYVIAMRNPVSVARSLRKRNGIPDERSYLLWTEHMLAALHGTEHCKRVVVDYDLLLQDPTRELQRIRQKLSMPEPRDVEALLSEYAANFLSEELRHTRFHADALRQTVGVPDCTVRLHQLLTELAQDRMSPDGAECRNEMRQLWDTVNQLPTALALAEQEYREAVALRALVAERDAKIVQLSVASSAQAFRIAEMELSLERERKIAHSPGKAASLEALLEAGDRQFVESAYLTLLLRLPDPGGLDYFLGLLRAGVPKMQILSDMIRSPEAAEKAVDLPGLREALERHRRSR